MLKDRVLAAVVALPVLLLILIFGGSWLNLLLFTAAVAVGSFEYFRMAFQKDTLTQWAGTTLAVTCYLVWGVALMRHADGGVFMGTLFFSLLAIYLYFLFRPHPIDQAGARMALAAGGLVYLPLLGFYLFKLQQLDQGWKYLLVLFSISWLNDTGGYFAGRFLGKHKLYEAVSPKKTWEGSVGGAACGVGGAFLFAWITGLEWSWYFTLPMALVAGAIGQMGDLVESLMKRSHDIKDSGGIIPGHGGILDRIDALIFAAPVVYYFITWFTLCGK